MIDLSTLKAGDTVKFRAGGESEVVEISKNTHDTIAISLSPENDEDMEWFKNGSYLFKSGHPFDIVEIIAKPFNWDDVKPGDAFVDAASNLHIFVGVDHRGFHVFETPGNRKDSYIGIMIEKNGSEELTRAPKSDIEVKS